ncbi:MAG TPA: alpha/beta hydrolase [Providencia sp.]|uniref:alpha/beta hydrolase family protein n=1 Tax=Providencia sp. TaxID=589 RepID=UPI000E834C41|nr:alpha/beta hydrolase [Providencia sp.]MBP6081930.1 alpha/beta hydrolase [Providencia sp.]HBO21972.1 alpha/beta hydrolase [Providencia sp.]
MKIKRFFLYLVLLAILASLAIIFTSNIDDFDLDKTRLVEIQFKANNNSLSGTLVLPKSETPNAIAIFIHGDGPQNRFSNDSYLPLINTLVENGIGVFSWDKAGVGESSGNWLTQGMEERANEVQAALTLLREKYPAPITQIGYLGFSQAGWVIPIAAAKSHPDFSIIIGGAINWRDQGAFYYRMRLNQTGISHDEIEQHITNQLKLDDDIFGATGSHDPKTSPDMTPDRFKFVVNNYLNDSSKDIPLMSGRILAIWGSEDLNVDAKNDACRYKRLLANNPNSDVVLIKNGTHGLLNASWFNYQLVEQWPWWKQTYFLYLGRDAYTSNSLAFIIDWIKHRQVTVPDHWQPQCS